MDIFNSWLVENYIAHRGLHNKENPENSLGAFQRAINGNYPIELDLHIIKDGTIVVFHDKTLSRITGQDGYTSSLTKEDLKRHKLAGTEFSIPTLEEVLTLVNGQVPLLIEIKNNGKTYELESKLIERLKTYNGQFAIQSFNPYSVGYFAKNAPEICRGQLSSFFKGEKMNALQKMALKRMIFNKKISKPHFISYNVENIPNSICKKIKKIPLIVWTVRSQEQYINAAKYVDNIIFENFEPKI